MMLCTMQCAFGDQSTERSGITFSIGCGRYPLPDPTLEIPRPRRGRDLDDLNKQAIDHLAAYGGGMNFTNLDRHLTEMLDEVGLCLWTSFCPGMFNRMLRGMSSSMSSSPVPRHVQQQHVL